MRTALIFGIVILSMWPLAFLHNRLGRLLRPRESGRRFAAWVLLTLVLIFLFTFALVWLIRLLFPVAKQFSLFLPQ